MDANTLQAVVSGAVAGAVTAMGAMNVPRSDHTYVDIQDVAIANISILLVWLSRHLIIIVQAIV